MKTCILELQLCIISKMHVLMYLQHPYRPIVGKTTSLGRSWLCDGWAAARSRLTALR